MIEDFDAIDFFRDPAFIPDPYPYFEYLRSEGAAPREPHHGIVMVTDYEDCIAVLHDTDTFSSCISVTGPFPGFPVPLEGDDISELIAQHRDKLPMSDQLPTFDPPMHTDHRALLMRLITPKRLRENEEFIWRLADRQLDEFIAHGRCEFMSEFASTFAMLVIADLLGVPEEDHAAFRARLSKGAAGSTRGAMPLNPLEYLYARFTEYVEDRRANPRDDVLTGLATATFPDGSLPEPIDVVRVAANLFAAGQETTVRLLATAFKLIAEEPGYQDRLRGDRGAISNFVEETLRYESPVKGDFRLSKVPATIGGVDIPAGTTVMVLLGAANRDPDRFEHPNEFRPARDNARQHIAFGHGVHTCPGAPLARAEAKIAIERVLERVRDIRIDESEHGPADARRFDYAPTYILRGLNKLFLEFTPVA